MKYFVYIFILLSSISLLAQPLTMVRSDDGWNGFLTSPEDIDLSKLSKSFNAQADTIVFIHGFNNSPSGAQKAYTISMGFLKSSMKSNLNYVGFYWPSNTLIDFGTAVKNANTSGRYLVYVLQQISRWYGSNSRKIHLVSHSLGGRVLLSTLQQNSIRYVKLGNCFSMAAAVHSNSYLKKFPKTNQPPQKTYVYYSHNDGVLKYLYALYYWLFERRFKDNSNYQSWKKLSLQEKIQYLKKLDKANAPTEPFDQHLYQSIKKAEKEAMGLIGAMLGSPKSISKVGNVEVTSFISGHSYWTNSKMMQTIARMLNK